MLHDWVLVDEYHGVRWSVRSVRGDLLSFFHFVFALFSFSNFFGPFFFRGKVKQLKSFLNFLGVILLSRRVSFLVRVVVVVAPRQEEL